jgi:alpha-galactosidase
MGFGKLRDGLAPTPPMGWNSWNRFQEAIDEDLIHETAEAIVDTGMRAAGYRYVVIDDCWSEEERDGSGDLVPDRTKFPRGMKALADDVHARGLRFGMYTDAGTKTCAEYPGSLAYEFRDARRFAGWGVDYLKVDWCHTAGMGPRYLYGKWAAALHATSRPIVFSVCEWGRHRPWEWAGTLGHLWRTTGDIVDTWPSMLGILDQQVDLHAFAGPDHWNDPDMLEVGNGGMSESEYRAHFSLWAILAAPLMAGNDLRAMSEPIRRILTAPEIIAVDQDPLGRQGRRVFRDGGAEVWSRDLAGGAAAAVLFNRGEVEREISCEFDGRRLVRDLWEREDVGEFDRRYAARVKPHDVVVVKLSPR